MQADMNTDPDYTCVYYIYITKWFYILIQIENKET